MAQLGEKDSYQGTALAMPPGGAGNEKALAADSLRLAPAAKAGFDSERLTARPDTNAA